MSDTTLLDAGWLDVASVNELLVDGTHWAHGPVTAIDAKRIGADYGFSGRVYRLRLTGAFGTPASLVAKFETADKIARAVGFRAHNEHVLSGHIPTSFGTRIDETSDRGLILLEDIHPATQGDDLRGCTSSQASTLVALIAMVHAHTWEVASDAAGDSRGRWATRDWEQARWLDRLERAAQRSPDDLDAAATTRLAEFPAEVADAYDRLQLGTRTWVHHDPHPDNALWRADGGLVMLDWSGAMVAPAGIDVAVLLSSLAFRPDAPLVAESLLAEYAAALREDGVDTDDDAIRADASAALRLLIRGTIGWAGMPEDDGLPPRALALRAQAPARALAALRWLDE